MMEKPIYGGFAACYIASTLDPKQMVKPPEKVIVYESKPRHKRKYKKN